MPLYCGFPVSLPSHFGKYDITEIANLYGVTTGMVFVTDEETIIGFSKYDEIMDLNELQAFYKESQQKLLVMLKQAGYETVELDTMRDGCQGVRPIDEPFLITCDYECYS